MIIADLTLLWSRALHVFTVLLAPFWSPPGSSARSNFAVCSMEPRSGAGLWIIFFGFITPKGPSHRHLIRTRNIDLCSFTVSDVSNWSLFLLKTFLWPHRTIKWLCSSWAFGWLCTHKPLNSARRIRYLWKSLGFPLEFEIKFKGFEHSLTDSVKHALQCKRKLINNHLLTSPFF